MRTKSGATDDVEQPRVPETSETGEKLVKEASEQVEKKLEHDQTKKKA